MQSRVHRQCVPPISISIPIKAANIDMNMLTSPSRVVFVSAGCAALILSACGGGGDGGAAPTLDFPLASAIST